MSRSPWALVQVGLVAKAGVPAQPCRRSALGTGGLEAHTRCRPAGRSLLVDERTRGRDGRWPCLG